MTSGSPRRRPENLSRRFPLSSNVNSPMHHRRHRVHIQLVTSPAHLRRLTRPFVSGNSQDSAHMEPQCCDSGTQRSVHPFERASTLIGSGKEVPCTATRESALGLDGYPIQICPPGVASQLPCLGL